MSYLDTSIYSVTGMVGEALDVVISGVVEGVSDVTRGVNKGITETVAEMRKDSLERLEREQKWINDIKKARDESFFKINSYIDTLVRLSATDSRLDSCKNVENAGENKKRLIKKRNNKAEEIRALRNKAMQSNDADEIERFAEEAKKAFESLQAEIQAEVVFFAKHGVMLSEYGNMNDDAIKMALAKRNRVEQVKMSVPRGEVVTEEMILYDLTVVKDSLMEFLCYDGLNDRQVRDLMFFSRELKKLEADDKTAAALKKKQIAKLFDSFNERKREITAELNEMRPYYEDYLKLTFDCPEERAEMADFEDINQIAKAIREVRKARKERVEKEYVRIQVDKVMKKHGLNLISSEQLERSETDARKTYGINEKTAVDVFVSDNGTITTKVVGLSFGEKPSEADEEALVRTEKHFCKKMLQIEDDLAELGIETKRKKTIEPDRIYNTWIQLSAPDAEKKKTVTKKRKRQTNNRVMYME